MSDGPDMFAILATYLRFRHGIEQNNYSFKALTAWFIL